MIFLLLTYAVFLLGFALFFAAALYHAYRFGYRGDKTKLVAGLYVGVVVAILVISFVMIGTTSWSGETV